MGLKKIKSILLLILIIVFCCIVYLTSIYNTWLLIIGAAIFGLCISIVQNNETYQLKSIIFYLPKLWFLPIWILPYFLLIKMLPDAFIWLPVPLLENQFIILLFRFEDWLTILATLVVLPSILTFLIYSIVLKGSLRHRIFKKKEHHILNEANSKYGYVYIIKGWREDALVKIGKTNNIKRRLIEAQSEQSKGTFTPNPIILKYEHYQFSIYYNQIEKLLHRKLKDKRFKPEGSTANEFFKLSPEEAREELDIAVREIEEEMTS